MRIKLFSILILVFLVIQCKNNNESHTLKNTLGDDKMISLLTEIHLIEGSLTPLNLQGDSATQYVLNNYEYLFKKSHTNSKEFKECMGYYVQHPKQLDKVYEKVIENLSKMQSEIKN